MDSHRWEQIQTLFHDAIERPEHERQAFLERACNGDPELMAEVLLMLQADHRGTSPLDRGLPDLAHQMLAACLEIDPAKEFGPYRLTRVLGEGGMGVVWLAERRDAGNLVAIKFLPHAGLSPARRDRFAREIKTLAKLKHPYIARLYDAGALEGGTPWFAMEYVEGIPLGDYLRQKQLPVEARLKLFRAICTAVHYAHGQEIIHRDLKPSNILVEYDGTPRLLDFGIARELHLPDDSRDLTRPALRFFSRDYAAPEWVRDGAVGFQTDVYSLGVILNEMIKEPRSSDLDVLCCKAMHQDPDERYASVEALIRDVDHYLKNEPLEARPDSWTYSFGKFVARHRWPVAAASLTFAFIAGLTVFFTLRLAAERDRANHETAIATATNRFLADDLLARTDPFRGDNAKESFVRVVKEASPHIDQQFRSEPLVAARLHQTLGRSFDNRSDFPQARREYDRAAQLFLQAEGPLSEDAISVHLARAQMEARSYEKGSMALAKSLLAGAESTIPRIRTPSPDLEIWLLTTRGVIALAANDARSANQNFAAALSKAQSSSVDEDRRRRIKQWLAFSYTHLVMGARAEALLRELIDEFSRATGPESPDTLKARMNLAQSLYGQGKYSEAIEEDNRIYPILARKLGEDNETTLSLLGSRAASEGSLGMYDEAIRDDLAVYRIAVKKQGPVSLYSIGMLSDAAVSQCQAGRYAEGEANARKAHQEAIQAYGPRAGLTGGTSYGLAICLIGRNRLDEASELLSSIDIQATTQMGGDARVAASIALAQGEIAARRGNYTLAKHYADIAAPDFDRPGAAPTDVRSLAELRKTIEAHRVAK